MSFSEISAERHPKKHHQEQTWSIDVSEHGLCFASPRRLKPDTMIHFSAEEENRFGLGKGIGRMDWSQDPGNTGLFCSGVELLS
jgi:hypothetical protein